MNTTPTTTATGARSDQYAIEAREAYQALADAVLSATGRFSPSGFRVVDGQGHPSFSITLTARQAELMAEALAR